MLLLCGQLDDVLRVAVPDGLRGVSNPSLQTISLGTEPEHGARLAISFRPSEPLGAYF
jgi:hypothetical protein